MRRRSTKGKEWAKVMDKEVPSKGIPERKMIKHSALEQLIKRQGKEGAKVVDYEAPSKRILEREPAKQGTSVPKVVERDRNGRTAKQNGAVEEKVEGAERLVARKKVEDWINRNKQGLKKQGKEGCKGVVERKMARQDIKVPSALGQRTERPGKDVAKVINKKVPSKEIS